MFSVQNKYLQNKRKISFGSVFTYMVALNTNVINFHEKHRGKIVGLLNAFFAGSPSVFAALYYHVFSGSGISNKDSFGNFMILFAVTFGIADVMCIIFLRIYSRSPIEQKEDITVNNQELRSVAQIPSDLSSNPENNVNQKDELSPLALFLNIDYQLLTWMFSFVSSVGLVFVNNLTEFGTTFKMDAYNPNLVLIIPITNAIVSVGIGVISDIFKEKVPRLFIFTSASGIFIFALILTMVFAVNSYAVLAFATTLCGIGIGLIWTMGTALMSELFSVKNMGRNWGIAIFLASIVGLEQQIAFGRIYDMNKTNPGDLYCFGIHCIQGGLGMSLGSAVISVLLGIVLIIKRRRRSMQSWTLMKDD
ncbi:hypothetical protein KUTeg_015397 [Tegillarca granosa]|uniref:Uncharacterized protein n=1 Tax=Tegillarca granosa TaxID=220873 RepID=A0ABQ9EQ14_TEGGR|nr:hypothetical protein KUTeg_015397 [Tegillarca granosa]